MYWPVGEAVNTPAFHAGIQGFESPTGHHIWTISSAGRAPALQAGGRRFDPVIVHHVMELWCRGLTCLPVTQEIAGSNPVSSAIIIYGDRGEVVNAPDCGSGTRGFDSLGRPMLGSSQVVRQRTLTP